MSMLFTEKFSPKEIEKRLNIFFPKPVKGTVEYIFDPKHNGSPYYTLNIAKGTKQFLASKHYEEKIIRFFGKSLKEKDYVAMFIFIKIVRIFFGASKKFKSLKLRHLVNKHDKVFNPITNIYTEDITPQPIIDNVVMYLNSDGACISKSGYYSCVKDTNTSKDHAATVLHFDNYNIDLCVYTYRNGKYKLRRHYKQAEDFYITDWFAREVAAGKESFLFNHKDNKLYMKLGSPNSKNIVGFGPAYEIKLDRVNGNKLKNHKKQLPKKD